MPWYRGDEIGLIIFQLSRRRSRPRSRALRLKRPLLSVPLPVSALLSSRSLDFRSNTTIGLTVYGTRDTWIPFTLEKIEKYNHNANIYHFSFGEEGKDKVSGGEVASVVLLRSPEGPDQIKDEKGKPIIRSVDLLHLIRSADLGQALHPHLAP